MKTKISEPSNPLPTPMLHVVINADRLVRYATRITVGLWSGDRRQQINAMADAAEANLIAGKIYNDLCKVINGDNKPVTPYPKQ